MAERTAADGDQTMWLIILTTKPTYFPFSSCLCLPSRAFAEPCQQLTERHRCVCRKKLNCSFKWVFDVSLFRPYTCQAAFSWCLQLLSCERLSLFKTSVPFVGVLFFSQGSVTCYVPNSWKKNICAKCKTVVFSFFIGWQLPHGLYLLLQSQWSSSFHSLWGLEIAELGQYNKIRNVYEGRWVCSAQTRAHVTPQICTGCHAKKNYSIICSHWSNKSPWL